MSIAISRGPATARYWSGPGFDGQIMVLAGGVAFRGNINYGKGASDIEFRVDPAAFAELARAMMAADRNEAVKAFGQALSDGIE